MRIAIGIGVTLLILAGLWAIWHFWISPPSKGSTENAPGGQSTPRPNMSSGPSITEGSISLPSILVREADIASGQNPSSYYGQPIPDSNLNSYNIHTTQQRVSPLIHFETAFNKICPDYVWYRWGLYKLINSQTSEAGVKVCYYKFDPSAFPKQISILMNTPPYTCSQYRYYISGIPYTYKESKTDSNISGTRHFCIYERQ